jgi:hypothetical protein
MSRIPTPENFEIASLKRKAEMRFDPMAPGTGTPWEDRASHGTAGAFFKTVGMSLFSPAKLAQAVRRPETTGDAFGFLILCAICWGISAFIHGMIWMHLLSKQPDILIQSYVLDSIVASVAAAAGLWLLFRLYNTIYGKLVAKEKNQSRAPAALLYNINAYALGPSVLAIIPYLGPPLALLWIAIDLVAVGMGRLRLRFAAALIDALIPLIAVVVIGFAGYYIGELLIGQVMPAYEVVPPSPNATAAP